MVPSSEIAAIVKQLNHEGFLHEERFAKSFVRGKFGINKWGRIKIRFELKNRHIPEKLITIALMEIDEEDYLKTLRQLIQKKMGEIKTEKSLNIRDKIINFAVAKGYEFDMILEALKTLKL